MRLLFVLVVTAFLAAGCGKKGALYLPSTAHPVATRSAPAK